MTFSQNYADYAIDFLQCLKLTGDFKGQPFILLPWEKTAISEFYGSLRDKQYRAYQYLYLEIPKKNGKSELAAGLGLFHTFMDEAQDGEVYIVAADKGNAGIIYNKALSMLKQSPTLLKRSVIRESTKEIRDKESNTLLKVLSSEAYSKHGYSPTCVIFDELHAQPNRDLWDVMTFGAGSARNQPVWIVLTTAGDDPDRHSIGWEQHEKARRILEYRTGKKKGNFDDPLWLPFIYGLPDDPDKCKKINIFDEALWYKVNPSLGHSIKIETLRSEANNARNSEAAEKLFRWLRLNQWIAIKAVGWLPLTLFDKSVKRVPLEKLKGKRCYLGQDLSSTTDLTALVLIFPPQKGLEFWYTLFFPFIPSEGMKERGERDHADYVAWHKKGKITATDGDCVDYDVIEATIKRLAGLYKIKMLGTDKWNSRMLTQRLMEQGIVDIVEISQDMAGLSPAMKQIGLFLRKGQMFHEEHPVARWNFGNVRCATDGNENIKPMKNKSIGRIDITVAWIIAMAVAMLNEKVDINEKINSKEWGM